MEHFFFPLSFCIFCGRAIIDPINSNHLGLCDEYRYITKTYFSHHQESHCEYCGKRIVLRSRYRHMDSFCKIVKFYKRRVRYCDIAPVDLSWLPFAERNMACSFLGVIVSYVDCQENTKQHFKDKFPYYYVYCIVSDETYPKYCYKFNVQLFAKEKVKYSIQPGDIIYGFNTLLKQESLFEGEIMLTTTEHRTMRFIMKEGKSLWSIYRPSGSYVGGSSLRPYDKHIIEDLLELQELAEEFNARPKLLPQYTYDQYAEVEREMDSRVEYPMGLQEPTDKIMCQKEVQQLKRVEQGLGAASKEAEEELKEDKELEAMKEQHEEVALEKVREEEHEELKEGVVLSVAGSEWLETEDQPLKTNAEEETEKEQPAIMSSESKEYVSSRRKRQGRAQRRKSRVVRLRPEQKTSE